VSTPLPPNRSVVAVHGRRAADERGFTLVEVTVTIIIISLLSAIVLVAVAKARRSAQQSDERQLLVALKQGIVQFESEFKFLPPLVTSARLGNNPLHGNSLQPVVLGENSNAAQRVTERAYLQGFTGPTASGVIPDDERYSVYSLSFYLMGACNDNDPTSRKPVDGAAGPSFTAPREDGSFTQKGKSYEAIYDPSTQIKRFSSNGVLNDRWGSPIRYYRWDTRPPDPAASPNTANAKARTMLPRAIGAGMDPRLNARARGARYALVILGENQRTDSRRPLEVGDTGPVVPPLDDDTFRDTADDIVEVE
jgi:prepilin-type N-terminal cleavage/methylation domain-containing protein